MYVERALHEGNARCGKGIIFRPCRKPEGFSGAPIFADDRKVEPKTDPFCRIKPDPSDEDGLIYMLHILDLGKCGVLVKNVRTKLFPFYPYFVNCNLVGFSTQGFINVRIWFPKLPGVVMMSDQEVIIMCKPPEPVVTSRKAASYAGKLYVV